MIKSLIMNAVVALAMVAMIMPAQGQLVSTGDALALETGELESRVEAYLLRDGVAAELAERWPDEPLAWLGTGNARYERGALEAAHTMWWLVFNNPEFCVGNDELTCDPAAGDLANADVAPSVFGGAGQVSDLYGRATFSAHAFAGEDNGLTHLFGPGITNPFEAEIHLIVQDHGPAGPLADAELLEQALRHPGVGCRAFDTDDDGEPDEFEPNHGICLGDIQGAAHAGAQLP